MGLGMTRWAMTLPHHGVTRWMGGKPLRRAYSVCHHKYAARSATLHLLVHIFMEELGSNVIDHVGSCLQELFSKTVRLSGLVALNGETVLMALSHLGRMPWCTHLG